MKRILTTLMAVAMIWSLCAVSAFADEKNTPTMDGAPDMETTTIIGDTVDGATATATESDDSDKTESSQTVADVPEERRFYFDDGSYWFRDDSREETFGLPHTHNFDFSNPILDIAPTCTEPGLRQAACAFCNVYVLCIETPALGHTWSDWTVSNDGKTEIRTCSVCEETETRDIGNAPGTNDDPSYVLDLSSAAVGGSAVSGTGKLLKSDGSAPDGKKYVYVVVNYERPDGSTWAVAGTYSVDSDGEFDLPSITGVSDMVSSVLVIGVDSKTGANWAGHNITKPGRIKP